VTATERVLVADDPSSLSPSGLFTNSFGDAGLGTDGTGGDIEVTTKVLDIRGGARFNATTQSGGNAGNITVNAEQSVSISGEFPSEPDTEFLGLGSTRASGIYTRTVGSEFCGDSCGNGGDTTINTRSFSLLNGAVLNNGTTNSGQAGTITVNATDNIVISGTLSDGRPGGIFSRSIGSESDAGSGGNIALTAGQSVTMSNGAAISASSTGPGNAGNISIDAGNRFEARNSSVTTKSEQAGGGNIEINARNLFRLVNSEVNASAFLDGGNITIDPILVLLQNSQILAQSIQGNGGNITITTPLFLSDQSSLVSASSQFGLNGTVTIQSPNAPISGQIQPLGKTPLIATSLLNQHCASLADGQFSSFTVAGRDSLPTEPGGWLGSPLAMLSTGAGEGLSGLSSLSGVSNVVRTGLAAHQIDQIDKTDQTDKPLLSLRQIAPAGFLTQAFAVEGSSSCQS
jgi:large exoprotein involved in heme utilization and adhesion